MYIMGICGYKHRHLFTSSKNLSIFFVSPLYSNRNIDTTVYLRGLEGDGVHTMSPADVPGIQPVHFQAAGWCMFPTEEVRV